MDARFRNILLPLRYKHIKILHVMRHIKLIALVVMACLTIGNAQGQLRFGLRGGMVINELKFNKKVFESENKVGWTAGLQLELDMPLGFGIDASAMYSHRNDAFGNDDHVYHRDYIEVPVHLKYKFGLIGGDRVLVPYVYTGPNFAFLVDESDYYKNDLSKTWKNRSMVTSWDVGVGLEIVRHLQINATYGIGMNNAFKTVGIEKQENGETIKGKDKLWTVTATYLF